MRRLITTIALAIGLSVATVAGPSPSPVGAHTSGQCFDIGRWWETWYWGSDPNGIAITAYVPVAWWGSQQCWFRYSNGTGTVVLLYDVKSGALAWLDQDWRTVERDTPSPSH